MNQQGVFQELIVVLGFGIGAILLLSTISQAALHSDTSRHLAENTQLLFQMDNARLALDKETTHTLQQGYFNTGSCVFENSGSLDTTLKTNYNTVLANLPRCTAENVSLIPDAGSIQATVRIQCENPSNTNHFETNMIFNKTAVSGPCRIQDSQSGVIEYP